MSGPTRDRYDAFLSYNSKDRDVVEELAARLRAEGLKLYLEVWELLPGREFQPGLAGALIESRTCVTFLGPNGLGPWQDQEIQVAIDRRVRDKDFHVIPVLLPGAERPRRGAVAHLEFLINASWVEFLKTTDDRRAFDLLVAGITGTKPPVPSEDAKCWEGRRPYRGLEAFGPDDAEFFFGRDNLADWLVSGLRREVRASQGVRFLPVLGPSGSGKSSVVLAGLLPRLKKGAIDGSEGWPVVVMRPGDDPLRNLAAELVARTSPENAPPDIARALGLIPQLQAEEQALDLFARMALSGRPAESRLLVVVDQFEEVFTYRPQDEEARRKFETARLAFFANLLHAASSPGGKAVVVLTMRSDFLGHCALFPRLNDLLVAYLEQVGPMQVHELREAIEQPAFKVGGELEPGLTERLLADVEGQPGALPLLQFALDELWTKRRGRKLTRADYDALGGISGALEHRANAIYASLPDEDKETCKRIFLRLVQPGEGVEDTKRRVPIDNLIPRSDPARAERVRRVIARLTDREARLITTEGPSPDAPGAIEVAHEALIRGWKELRGWIEADRAGMRTHDRLSEAAKEWAAADPEKKDDYLFTGTRLAEAREWASTHPDDLSDLEGTFLAASAEAHEEEAERERRLREDAEAQARKERALRKRFVVVAAVAGTLALFASGLGWLAKWNGDKASDEVGKTKNALKKADDQRKFAEEQTKRALAQERISESRRLAALSDLVRPRRLDQAVLLALEASNENTFEAWGSLQRCLHVRPEVSRFLDIPESDVKSVASGPGGTIAVGYEALGYAGGVTLFGAKGEKLWTEPITEGPVTSVAFGPGGAIAAGLRRVEGESDGVNPNHPVGGVLLFNAEGERLLLRPTVVREGCVTSVAFESEGTIAAGFGYGVRAGGVAIFDAKGKRLQAGLWVREGDVTSVAFGPGRAIAAGFSGGGGEDCGVVLFNTAGRLRTKPIEVREGRVTSVAFGPERAIVAGFTGRGGGVVLLDVKRERRLPTRPMPVREGDVTSVASGPKGIITAGYDVFGGAIVLDGNPFSWRAEAEQLANRNFTRKEWKLFFPDTPYRRTIRSFPWPHDLSEAERMRAEAWEKAHPVETNAP